MWRKIRENGCFSVSDGGEVRNDKTKKTLPQHKTYNGYLRVRIKGKWYRVHRLVAEAFVDNKNGYKQVNHIDGDKRNNRAENLEWCTAKYNIAHAYKIGLKKPCYDNIRKPKAVEQLDMDGNIINVFESTMDAQRQLGIDSASISHVCTGRQKTSHGYKWRYAISNK